MRASLRPRAATITRKSELDKLLADALGYISDSHFYIIPEGIATEEPNPRTADGRGTVGLAVRVAEGNVVAWRVESGSPAWNAGIRPGQRVKRIEGKDTDSAMKRVQSLPELAQPRALADMLHSLNGLLSPAVGETAHVWTNSEKNLVAIPARGLVSQFGNLPPLAGLVKTDHIISSTPSRCIGLIAFNIWLPALAQDLENAVDATRGCDGIVIDLRGNPGGLGAMVMGFGGYFVDSTRSLGTMRSRQVSLNFVINPRTSRSDGRTARTFTGPVAIIVDPMTASTSEIFAAGMQRIGRARVFGERSAGAALPALMERLPSGDVFVHAVADFTDPEGKRIEGAGAVPDQVVPLKISDLESGFDAPLDAAVRWITSLKKS
jgi:carboxyl-terminal processing protease